MSVHVQLWAVCKLWSCLGRRAMPHRRAFRPAHLAERNMYDGHARLQLSGKKHVTDGLHSTKSLPVVRLMRLRACITSSRVLSCAQVQRCSVALQRQQAKWLSLAS